MNYDVALSNSGPDPVTRCTPGDKIVWTNATTRPMTLNLPTCVSPQNGPVTLPPGQPTGTTYTVNSNANGRYSYSYASEADEGTRNGTIDVG